MLYVAGPPPERRIAVWRTKSVASLIDLDDVTTIARKAAIAAGRTVVEHWNSYQRDVRAKGTTDIVSAADLASDRIISAAIRAAYPDHRILSEEDLHTDGFDYSGPLWVVDPIDGTANFVRGIPQFCISLAYVRDGRTQIGIIYDPMADELFVAERGRGATLNGEPIRVSGLDEINSSTIEAGWSNRLPFSQYVDLIGRLLDDGAGVRRGGSGALALAYVSAGRLDGYCELHMNSWDALAGLLLIEEAGGWVNDFLANDGLRDGNAVLGCTPGLRERLVRLTGVD